MIIQKLASAIRRQDWFQVLVEVMIVIVGIFLGLQVQAWYEGQAARQEEARLVEYFIADLEKNNDILAQRVQIMDERIELGYRALEILEQDELAGDSKDDFERAIILMSRTQAIDAYLNSLNEENVDKILDIELRQVLDRFLGYIKRTSGVADNIKTTMFNITSYVRQRTGIIRFNVPSVVTNYDFDALKEDIVYKASLTNAVGGTIQYRNTVENVRISSKKMIEILKQFQTGDTLMEVEFAP